MNGAADTPQRGAILRDAPFAPEIVWIDAGSFTMGIPAVESRRLNTAGLDQDARPTHRVSVPAFWLGRYPVTRDEYAAFADATGYGADRGAWREPGFPQTGRDPVVNVGAADATAYAAWLSGQTGQTYRLPSEAEWEYAARAGTTASRYWGDTFFDADLHVWSDRTARWTAPVDERLPNPFGLHDMLGNVWEWTADSWHASYRGAPADGSAWIDGDEAWRVLRGGAWYGPAKMVRAGLRFRVEPDYRDTDTGFRLARADVLP